MRDGVYGDDGHEAERDPDGLAEEGDEESGRGFFDLVEAGVMAVGDDALEEVCSYCLFVS